MENMPKIFDIPINITEEDISYNKFRKQFYELIQNSMDKFKEYYLNETVSDNNSNVYNKYLQFGNSLLNDIVSTFIKELIKNKIYEIDSNIFLELCNGENTHFQSTIQNLNDDNLKEDNKSNSNNGGISNIILNATGLFNKSTSSLDNTTNQVNVETLKNPHTLALLQDAIYNDASTYFKTFINILQQNNISIKNISSDDIKKSKAIFNNLSLDLYEDENLKKSMWVRILEYYPYDIEYYTLLLKKYENNKNEIIQLINWFNMPLQKIVDNLLNQKYSLDNIDNIEIIEKIKNDIIQELSTYGLEKSYLIDMCDTLIENIKNKNRTYLGILYDTEQLKNQAEAFDTKLKSWIDNVTPNDLGMTINLYLYILNEEPDKQFPMIRQTNAVTMQNIIIKDIKENHNHTAGELDYYIDILTNDKNIAIHQELLRVLQKQSKRLNKNLLGIFQN